MDPYEVLEVSRDATQEDIGRSYRVLARRYHPDHNGNETAEKFKHVTHAYEILGDEDRRRRYDETGQTEQPKNEALSIVASCVHDTILEIVQGGNDPEKVDVLKIVKAKLKKIRGNLERIVKMASENAEKFRKIASRMNCDEAENYLKVMILQPALQFEREASEAKRKLEELDVCDEILRHYSYQFDNPDDSTWPPRKSLWTPYKTAWI